jgi:hypothetical protein
MRVATQRKSSAGKKSPTKRKGFEPSMPVSVGAALSSKLEKAIVRRDGQKAMRLKFDNATGYTSPRGNPIQVVYLKSGVTTYVDVKAGQLYSEASRTPGRAIGPFKLPKDVGRAIVRAVAADLRAKTAQATDQSTGPDFIDTPTYEENRAIRQEIGGDNFSFGNPS